MQQATMLPNPCRPECFAQYLTALDTEGCEMLCKAEVTEALNKVYRHFVTWPSDAQQRNAIKAQYKIALLILSFAGTVTVSDISFYEILGVTKQATTQEIRQAYKKLAIKLHPDKNPDETEQEKFLKITEAYETLKDPDKRHKYDLYGSFPSYSRKYDYRSQAEYDNLYYNGLYHNDPFVETLSGKSFYTFLKDGLYFINFYSPFCPPCQNVADHWKKLAELYKGIIKVGAVNCKYHNSFCYNSMRIGSYPTLIFYPNGREGNYFIYRGERTIDALEEFVLKYVRNKVHVPVVSQIKSKEVPIAYILGENRIEKNALTRIAYQLKGLVTVAIIEDDNLRSKLTDNDYSTVVFRYKDVKKEIDSTDEKIILKEIINQMPSIESIDPDKLKKIRNSLRSGAKTPWVLYFSSKEADKLELYQTSFSMPDVNFGEINCDKWSELCSSLQVESAWCWGVLKRGGAYQRLYTDDIQLAVKATNLHTLSPSELNRILDDETGVWVLLVVPHKLSWSHLSELFTRASLHFLNNKDVHFGITVCTSNTDQYCRRVAYNEPTILVQNGTTRNTYSGRPDQQELVEFIHLLKDTSDMYLSEKKVLEILDVSSRDYTWLVAHLPARCGIFCKQLTLQWMKVYQKLRPLDFVRVGILDCESSESQAGFCNNIRMPTARLYPIASGHHYSISLQQVNEAPYILEWALEHIDDSVQKLNWHSFTNTVTVEELNPSSDVKPWLVYFHSPRCYRCYEMYADFAITGILLNNAVQIGKVNCITERGLCQNEQITSYPSLKLYLNRNRHQSFSSVINVQLQSYEKMLEYIKPHLSRYNGNMGMAIGVKRDEL